MFRFTERPDRLPKAFLGNLCIGVSSVDHRLVVMVRLALLLFIARRSVLVTCAIGTACTWQAEESVFVVRGSDMAAVAAGQTAEVRQRVLLGHLEGLPAQDSKVVRLFLSSTFTGQWLLRKWHESGTAKRVHLVAWQLTSRTAGLRRQMAPIVHHELVGAVYQQENRNRFVQLDAKYSGEFNIINQLMIKYSW